MATKKTQGANAETAAERGATYAELQAQIAALQAEAEALRQKEIAGVIAEIKAQIVTYGLSAADLGLAPKGKRSRSDARHVAYADGNGNTWGGRGKRPDWLRALLAEGRSLDEFKVA
ncbi:H-NS histone family protein [Rubrivivax gelatinosus]|uniref:H-NS histone family protein n=1 Tax=Rubrivivax gelatinosus TaxID=28068 RepID=UPI000681EE9D|nr:H-NS histone family protein [Rubrivivax gelatinosus]MBG6083204.1 DNA-binding protein H-NS [Rubrivivax gelatinosus]